MADLADAVRAKVRWRLVAPFIFLMFLAALDRANVSFAALRMNADLHLTPSQYGLGAGVFFIGFIAGQYPSVLLLGRLGIGRWLAVVLATWGVAAAALAIVNGPAEFLILRVILGFAEAGLTPGIVLYLGAWSPPRDRAATFALPMLAVPISLVLGGPLSGWILAVGAPFQLADWRWMFLIEGAPVVLVGLLAWRYFPRTPDEAPWLGADEKAWIAEHRALVGPTEREGGGILEVLADSRVWGAAAMWFLILSGSYAVTFWLPQVARQMSGLGDFQIGLVSALPWIGNGLGVGLGAIHSDRTQERFWHFGVAALVTAAGFGLIGLAPSPLVALGLLLVGATAMGVAQGVFWAIPTELFSAQAMAPGIAFVNMVGCAGGFLIPWIIGVLRQASGGFGGPVNLVAVLTALSFGVLCAIRPLSRPAPAEAS
jgi:ACS family tartrate transporter-like MFS transporter